MTTSSVNNNQIFTADKLKQEKEKEALKTSSDTTSNPLAKLDKDAFMKLLLTELQYQDPTSPMDSDKMLSQTSQLAALETQENTNRMMKDLVSQMQAGSSMYALDAIGKMAFLGSNSIILKAGQEPKFEIYFKEPVKEGVIEILDKEDKVVRVMPMNIENPPASKGIHAFSWNGMDNNGKKLESGEYKVRAKFTTDSGKSEESYIGSYPVESVRFVNGKAEVKLGSSYVPIEQVQEFYGA